MVTFPTSVKSTLQRANKTNDLESRVLAHKKAGEARCENSRPPRPHPLRVAWLEVVGLVDGVEVDPGGETDGAAHVADERAERARSSHQRKVDRRLAGLAAFFDEGGADSVERHAADADEDLAEDEHGEPPLKILLVLDAFQRLRDAEFELVVVRAAVHAGVGVVAGQKMRQRVDDAADAEDDHADAVFNADRGRPSFCDCNRAGDESDLAEDDHEAGHPRLEAEPLFERRDANRNQAEIDTALDSDSETG